MVERTKISPKKVFTCYIIFYLKISTSVDTLPFLVKGSQFDTLRSSIIPMSFY